MSLLDPSNDLGGLNDDTNIELPENGVNIKPPELDDDSNPVMLILPEPADAGADIDAAIAAMPNYDAKIAMLADGAVTVTDVKEMANQILSMESIGQADAEEIIQKLPELENEVGPVKEYSQLPSKTNLIGTRRYVGNEATRIENEFLDDLKNFLESEFGQVLAIKTLESALQLKERFDVLQQQALEDLPLAIRTNGLFAIYKAGEGNKDAEEDRTHDFRTRSLSALVYPENYEVLPKVVPAPQILGGLIDVFQNDSISEFFNRAKCMETYDGVVNFRYVKDDSGKDYLLNYLDLLTFLSRGAFIDILIKSAEEFDSKAADLQEVVVNQKWMEEKGRKDIVDRLSHHIKTKSKILILIQQYRLLAGFSMAVMSALRQNF